MSWRVTGSGRTRRSALAGDVISALDLALAMPGTIPAPDGPWPTEEHAPAEERPRDEERPPADDEVAESEGPPPPSRRRRRRRKTLAGIGVLALVAAGAAGTAEAVWAWAPKPAPAPVPKAVQRPVPLPPANPEAPGIALVSDQAFDLPDPMVVDMGNSYAVFFSTAFLDSHHYAVPELTGVPGDWGQEANALPTLPKWASPMVDKDEVWAPDVVHIGGRYVMYFSADVVGKGTTHCIGLATSDSVTGPYVPYGDDPLICQLSQGGDIDPQAFYDPSGPDGPDHPWYMIWKSDNNHIGESRTYVWAAPLSNDGLQLAGTGHTIFTAQQPWQAPVLEAPQLVTSPYGQVWMFFSAGAGFLDDRYAMGAASCSGPLGPCSSYGTEPLVSTNEQGPGPGEETAFVASDGSVWLLYNPWHTGMPFAVLRPAEAVRIAWTRLGPYVAEAGQFPSPEATPAPPPSPAVTTTHQTVPETRHVVAHPR